MPSINLIWEQRATRQKNQRVSAGLIAVVGLAVVVILLQLTATGVKRHVCERGIQDCEKRIQTFKPDADRNQELQAQIKALEPTLALLTEAQRMTLRWVSLIVEVDRSLPNPKEVVLNQFTFTPLQAADDKDSESLVGNVTVVGQTRSYRDLSEMMRFLLAQRHVGQVRLLGAQTDAEKGLINFSVQLQFKIPEDEEKTLMAATESRPAGGDYAAVLEKAGQAAAREQGVAKGQTIQ